LICFVLSCYVDSVSLCVVIPLSNPAIPQHHPVRSFAAYSICCRHGSTWEAQYQLSSSALLSWEDFRSVSSGLWTRSRSVFFFPSVSFIFPLVLSVLVGPKKQVSLVSKSGRLSFLPASHYHLVLPVFPSPTWAKPAPSAATSPPPVLQAFSRSPATVGTLVSSGFLLLLSLFLLLL
jgi:hypothetical protein